MKLKTIINPVCLLLVLLLSINTVSAWTGSVSFNGKATWNGAGVSNAGISVLCPTIRNNGVSLSGSTSTDANGDYSISLGYGSSTLNNPPCTITVTHSFYDTIVRNDAYVLTKIQNFALTRRVVSVSGSVSPDTATVSYSYSGDSAVNSCSVSGGSYSCMVEVGRPFTVSASATGYIAFSRDYPSGISAATAEDISMSRVLVDVPVTVSPLTTVLTLTSGGTTCDGTGASRTCHVYEGNSFTIEASAGNYVTQTSTYAAGTSSVNIVLTQTLYTFSVVIESFNGSPVNNPVVSMTSGSGSCLGLSCTVYSGEAFAVTVDAAGFNSVVYANTFTSSLHPSSVSVKLHGVSYSLSVNVNDVNDDGSQVVSVGSSVSITGEGTGCSGSNGVFSCSVYKGEAFTLKASKAGYTIVSRVLTLESAPSASEVFSLLKGLRVNVADDFGNAVSEGRIELKTHVTNGATTTETLISTISIPSGNAGLSFYSLFNPLDYPLSDDAKRYFKVYFYDGDNYLDLESAVTEIPNELSAQVQVNMGTYKTWRTNVNVVDSLGASVTGYDISALNVETYAECHVGYCVLDQRAHSLTVSKTGYVTNSSVVIGALNNGSPVSVVLNKTLMVNVTDQNGNYASGLVSVVNSLNVVVASGSLVSGVAWLAVDPLANSGVLSVHFNDSNYFNVTGILGVNSVNSASTSFVSLQTRTMIKLTVNVTDYYTNQTLSGYSLNAFNGSVNYGSTNPLSFDINTSNPFVNISVSKEGYFSTVKEGQPINGGVVTIGLKPKVAVFLNTRANITVINTKKTSSTEDDEQLMTVATNNDSIASIPLAVDGLQFLLNISAVGFKGMILGPYEVGSEILIGSRDGRVTLESVTSGMPSGAPVILSISNYPESALTTNDVTISVRVSDAGRGNNTILACNMKLDNNNYVAMGGNYNSYDVTVSRNIGKLVSGTHVLRVGCMDVDGWSNEGIYSFNVRVPTSGNQTSNNTVVNNASAVLRFSELMAKYELLAKAGLVTDEVKNALVNAENKINTPEAERAITLAENQMPLVTLMGSSNVRTVKSDSPESVAKLIANRENQPYSVSELKGNLQSVIFTKTAMKYLLDNEPKTVITLKVFSREANPDAFIADVNPASSSGRDTITTSDGVITYFIGLDAGENVFEYVVNGDVTETVEPVVFTMAELSSTEKAIKGITGFSISIPGLVDIPVIYIGIGIIGLIVLLKILI